MEFISIIFVGAVAILVIWTVIVLLRHYASDERPARLPRMLARLGLSFEGVTHTELADHLPTAARICLLCGNAVECDHVLATKSTLDEPLDFCPNASFIRLAKRDVQAG